MNVRKRTSRKNAWVLPKDLLDEWKPDMENDDATLFYVY
jgi:hypothetical protein